MTGRGLVQSGVPTAKLWPRQLTRVGSHATLAALYGRTLRPPESSEHDGVARKKSPDTPASAPTGAETQSAGSAASGLDFEAALAELETLVERMEQGEMTLEQSLADFERGIALTRTCQEALKSAEQKVRILMDKNGDAELTDFTPDDD